MIDDTFKLECEQLYQKLSEFAEREAAERHCKVSDLVISVEPNMKLSVVEVNREQ